MIKYLTVSLSLLTSSIPAFATYLADCPNAPEEGHKHAKQIPVSTSLILGDSSATGTCFFVTPTLAVTAAHISALQEKKKIGVIGPDCCLAYHNVQPIIDLGNTIRSTKWSFFETKLLCEFVSAPDPIRLPSDDGATKQWTITADELKEQCEEKFALFQNPEAIIKDREMLINGKNHTQRGSDLAILTFKKPIEGFQSSIQLSDLPPEVLVRYPAFVLGYSYGKFFNNGKQEVYLETQNDRPISLSQKLTLVSLPALRYCKESNCFVACYSSKLTEDESFVGTPKDEAVIKSFDPQLFGIVKGGMSGGPLIFKTDKGLVIGGVVSQTYHPIVIEMFDRVLSDKTCMIAKKERHKIEKLRGKYLKRVVPTFTSFQAFTPELLSALKDDQKEANPPAK